MSNTYLENNNKSLCTGCGACSAVCVRGCIVMCADSDMFAYPIKNNRNCNSCGRCITVCPHGKTVSAPEEGYPKIYTIKHKNKQALAKSTSGGMFAAAASCIIHGGGVVYGAAYTRDFDVEHIRISRIDELERLQKSKYIQSGMGDIMRCVEQDLVLGIDVMFSGTPCQIAGLKGFLGKEYGNLVTFEVLCFGVPSKKVWHSFMEYIQKRYKSKIVKVDFRDKAAGWKRSSLSITLESGKRLYKTAMIDAYSHLYYGRYNMRPSCGLCEYSSFDRAADITAGDHWFIERFIQDSPGDDGASLVMINSPVGEKCFNDALLQLEVIDTAGGYHIQRTMSHPRPLNALAVRFNKDFENRGIRYVLKKYGRIRRFWLKRLILGLLGRK